jgi:hypothetical protein
VSATWTAAHAARLGRRPDYEESTGTLFCGDLFTSRAIRRRWSKPHPGPAIAAEDLFGYSALNPDMGRTLRRLADLAPRTLALMHGPAYAGDGAAALLALADRYDRRSAMPPRLAEALDDFVRRVSDRRARAVLGWEVPMTDIQLLIGARKAPGS